MTEVDQQCDRIRETCAEQIVCQKGCDGCCRRHIDVFAVEAVCLSLALQKLPAEMIARLRQKARGTTSFGPCPLLEAGACLMYASRTILCRTHGLPILSEYRGSRSIGYCQKNFQQSAPIPADPVIDLAPLNSALRAINQRFVAEFPGRLPAGERLTIAQALFLEI